GRARTGPGSGPGPGLGGGGRGGSGLGLGLGLRLGSGSGSGSDLPERLDLATAVVDSVACSPRLGGRVAVRRRACPGRVDFARTQGLLPLVHSPTYLQGLRARAAVVEEGFVEDLTGFRCH
ncbi:unnamed protein product, partial [Discosporangium mesarthrocarpum]